MIYVGIDYSLTSPAMTILKEDEFYFYSYFDGPENYTFLKRYRNHSILKDKINVVRYTREKEKVSYMEKERSKMKDYIKVAGMIVLDIEQMVKDDDFLIGIEGYSYGSRGMSMIDMVQGQTVLRTIIGQAFGFDHLCVFSPSEIKKSFTGKGNADKELMIECFRNEGIHGNKFFEWVKDTPLDNLKPVDDLVDSYSICKLLKSEKF